MCYVFSLEDIIMQSKLERFIFAFGVCCFDFIEFQYLSLYGHMIKGYFVETLVKFDILLRGYLFVGD